MVRKSVVAALCVMSLFLAACGSNASEPVDPVRAAFNRIVIEKCIRVKAPCVGGFVRFSDGQISRIEWGEPKEFRTIGIRNLEVALNYWRLDQMEFVLPDSLEWNETAVAYARQFVERREKK